MAHDGQPQWHHPPDFDYLLDVTGQEAFGSWWIPNDANVRDEKLRSFLERHPGSHLVPFAFNRANDDAAFFESGNNAVVVWDEWDDPAFTRVARFEDLRAWMHSLVEEWLGSGRP